VKAILLRWLRQSRERDDAHLVKPAGPSADIELLGELIRVVNEAQGRDAEDERRLYQPMGGDRPSYFQRRTTIEMAGDNVVEMVSNADKNKTIFSNDVGDQCSSLYFVECITKWVDGVTLPVPITGFGAREVTLVYMSFTNVDLFMALPARVATLIGPW